MREAKNSIRVSSDKLRIIVCKIFESVGMPEEDAFITSDSLVESDLNGVYSHGVMRVAIYVKRLELKSNESKPIIKLIKDKKGTAILDGGNGMGQVVSYKAMKIAIEKAKKYGISSIGVLNSNHNGAEAYYVKMALKHDMIGYCLSVSGRNILAPHGGFTPLLGNNPFAISAPTKDEIPIIFDMACSVAARGWIKLALKEEINLPEGWALNIEGKPTIDPQEAYDGSVLPIAGYKGYGLALMISIFSAVLTGAAIAENVSDLYGYFDRKQNVGHFIGALNIEYFISLSEFKERMDRLIRFIKTSKRFEGVEKIYLPGEIEHNTNKINLEKGIPIQIKIYEELKNLAKKYNIKWEI
ncbi:putative oxidoreductase YjmC [subsurface metagenome]